MKAIALALLLFVAIAWSASGQDPAPAGGAQKTMDFEGEVVEGVAKQPLDSLNQIAEGDERSKMHLYRKRDNFRNENQETVRRFMETY